MPDFKVKAKYNGDTVQFFIVGAKDTKEAFTEARKEANNIFSFNGTGQAPSVSVVAVEEKDEDE